MVRIEVDHSAHGRGPLVVGQEKASSRISYVILRDHSFMRSIEDPKS